MTTYTVISNADSGAGTLRSYLGVAQDGDIINFAPTVQLITLANPLEIKTNVTIEGSQPANIGAPGVIISGNSVTREFTIDGGVSTKIDGVELSYGAGTGTASFRVKGTTLTTTNTTVGVGSIYNNGNLTLSNSLIDHNKGTGFSGYNNTSGSAAYTPGGGGGLGVGGIYVASGATLNLVGSTNSFAANTGTGGLGGHGARGFGDQIDAQASFDEGGRGGAGAVATSGLAKQAAQSGYRGFGLYSGDGAGGAPSQAGQPGTRGPDGRTGSGGGGGGGDAFADYGGLGTVNIVTCYVTGTLIRTTRGDVAVEALRVGDSAITASGARRPVMWIGHRTVDCRHHQRPRDVLPVRISAHALGESRPSRDLLVSPGHSICVDVVEEVLIPAVALINGSTIQQIEVDEVTYWHVELESHDIILAENMPAESYLDMGNRGFFREADLVDLAAGPDTDLYRRTHADFCRPVHDGGALVEVVRAQLQKRAEAVGWSLASALDVYLEIDGRRVDPAVRGLTARFQVPAGAKDVWLMSATARPSDLGSGDTRDLGVNVAALRIDDGFEARDIAIDDPRLCLGFHEVEDGARRWTSGRARLPAALWDGREDGFFLRVELAGLPVPRWTAPAVGSLAPEQPRLAIVA